MTGEIRKSIVIDALPDVVFRAITSEKELTNWFPDQARFEPRVGGFVQFRFYQNDKEHHRVEGKVLEIIPNKKVSYSWSNKSDPNFPDTAVTWTLEKLDGNKTRVTLVHTGFDPKSDWYNLHGQGWSYFMDRLDRYCQSGSKLPPPAFADRADRK
jgi:uncharacterized protein YndB with AHSA1/START domain